MLEFSDKPYQFFEPKPSRPVIWAGRMANRFFVLPGKEHNIQEIEILGATEEIREERAKNIRHLFVFNHPTHSDPQFVTEIHRRLGVNSSFMAAYDVFLRSDFNKWVMQRLGHFSIDREGSDRKAMSTAIDILSGSPFALNIFPEGNVYLTNDRVTPFLDGTAFIALRAQKAAKESEVRIVPLSLKYTHLTDVSENLIGLGKELGRHTNLDPITDSSPLESLVGLGMHLLREILNTLEGVSHVRAEDPERLFEELKKVASEIVVHLEEDLSMEPTPDEKLIDRIRKIRSKIHQLRTEDGNAGTDLPAEKLGLMADKAILAFRIIAYLTPYVTERPTLDRYSETVERMCEDFHSKPIPAIGPRKAIAKVHPSISIAESLEEAGGKTRDAIQSLTRQMEESVQAGVDEINAANDSIGGRVVEREKL